MSNIQDHVLLDAIVIGGGGAVCAQAPAGVTESGVKTACITKVFPTPARTLCLPSGGIPVRLPAADPNDDWRLAPCMTPLRGQITLLIRTQ